MLLKQPISRIFFYDIIHMSQHIASLTTDNKIETKDLK